LYHYNISQKIDDLADDQGEPTGTRVTLTLVKKEPGKDRSPGNLLRKMRIRYGPKK
jgi:hypothetical protein